MAFRGTALRSAPLRKPTVEVIAWDGRPESIPVPWRPLFMNRPQLNPPTPAERILLLAP